MRKALALAELAVEAPAPPDSRARALGVWTSRRFKLTRRDVAKLLGISKSGVIQITLKGKLHPEKDRWGVWRFDPAEVEVERCARAKRGQGQLAAARDRTSPAQTQFLRVIAARLPLDLLRTLSREFLREIRERERNEST